MTTQFTPGKWIADRHHLGDGWRVFVQHTAENDQHDAICDIETWQSDEQTEANARLVAKSPVLLEACKDVNNIINNYSHVPALFNACKILQAAIGDVEGRE